ncbi:hypothetical protein H0H81_009675 [Sphagnurus paluster]|uniref:Uncharacterized protein n=1 Tax=Sphagnurus paluster TaxID=117069 RepID=A0A9P7FTF2_9AGAR|nr:hypothetical protein H0H81_009675 [Sphagnurus paluster]
MEGLPGYSMNSKEVKLTAIERDIIRLHALVSQPDLSEMDDLDVLELLQRLENADGMADLMESKVDNILAQLDGILDSADADGQAHTTGEDITATETKVVNGSGEQATT